MKAAIILNYKKDETVELAKELDAFLEARNVELAKPQDRPGFRAEECAGLDFSDCDAGILLGGDGTLLSACRYVKNRELPLLSVNMGRLGFLTDIEKSELFPALERFLNGEYVIEDRTLVRAELFRNGELIYEAEALNDFVLTSVTSYRSTTITCEIDGQFVSSCKATGVIFSSATGSTAYALSAGGPIIMPQTQALELIYLAAHNIYDRPVILPESSVVKVLFSNNAPCSLIADGQAEQEALTGDELFLSAAPQKLRLLRLKNEPFFSIINNKMINKK